MTVYIGIDWSRKKHDIVITDERGKRISSGVLEQSQAGYAKLEQMCEQLQVSRTECRVGLETAHTLLIDYLWQQGYEQVFVIHPNIVNRSRERYRQSGAYNDQSDAYVISDLLRTDGHRFTAWQPGSELLQTLRRETSLAHFLTRQSTRQANRLEAILLRYYPVARQLFSWPSPIVCHFVMTYPTPQASQALSYDEFCQFLKSHRHTQSRTWVTLYDRLHASQPKASAAVVAACQEEAKALAQMLLMTLRTQKAILAQLSEHFQAHEDAPIFASLPGAGALLAPALLVKFGEDRKRFPSPASVQMLAGTAPVTRSSGNRKQITFRRACDKSFRYFIQQFARTSLSQSAWATAYFKDASGRKLTYNHALRCLANRWLSVIWKLWSDHKPYDEAYHLQQRMQRRQARQAR